MSKRGLLSTLNRFTSVFRRRKLVGKDTTGNLYYTKVESDFDGESFERRFVVPGNRGDHTTYDPSSIPPQWRQWLSKTRTEAPSENELLQETDRISQLKAKVFQLNAEEQRRRLQAAEMGEEPETAGGPSLDRFLGQLTNKGYGADHQESASDQQDGREGEQATESKSSKSFQPETWQPGGS